MPASAKDYHEFIRHGDFGHRDFEILTSKAFCPNSNRYSNVFGTAYRGGRGGRYSRLPYPSKAKRRPFSTTGYLRPFSTDVLLDIYSATPDQLNGGRDPGPTSNARERVDTDLVWWDSESDPHNPQNWSPRRKWTQSMVNSWLQLIAPLASSMLAPGLPQVAKDLHIGSPLLKSFVLSIYMVGMALGSLVAAPISETYGRLPLYHTSGLLFCIFTLLCGLANSGQELVIFRFLTGFLGTACVSVASGACADVWKRHELGLIMSIGAAVLMLGPCVGPMIGGAMVDAAGWRWVLYTLACVGGFNVVLVGIIFRETHAPTILRRKAKRLRKETGIQTLRSKLDAGRLTGWPLIRKAIQRPMKLLLRSPVVLLMSLVTAILYGVLYLLITSIPFIFGPRYDFSAKSTGLVYLALGLGMMLALFVCGRYSDRIVKERRRALVTNDKASSPSSSGIPEQRLTLLLTIPGTVCTVCGLLLYGWTAEHRLHWTAPVSGLLLFGFGLIMITSPISIYMIECFLQNAASAMAATMFLRSVIAGLMPLSGLDLYDKFGVGYGTTILAGLAAGASGLVFLCRFHGPSIRKKFPVKL